MRIGSDGKHCLEQGGDVKYGMLIGATNIFRRSNPSKVDSKIIKKKSHKKSYEGHADKNRRV
jgi:hypothetical protein